jgi:SAM-dependent methyltransferase
MADSGETRRAVWTRHWATGAAHSCVGSFADTYGGALARVWQEELTFTAPGIRVLDIATGSGALPRLMLRLRPEMDLSIDAVDLAAVAPDWPRQLPAAQAQRLRFHQGVSAESLPFPDACFGMVISQYGLEYADLQRAVPELLRVLAPGGRVALVLHHAASRPVTLAAVEIAHIDWLHAEDGLLPAAHAMLAPMARAATPEGRASLARDPAADAIRERFNAAQSALGARARAAPDGADVLAEAQDGVAQLLGLAMQQGQAIAEAGWSALDQGLADARWRLQELRECALDADAVDALCRSLQAHGLQPTRTTLTEQGHLMGWRLNAG